MLNIACGSGILFNDINGRKNSLVFVWPLANKRETAHQALIALHFHYFVMVTENNVAHARRHTTVCYRNNAFRFRKSIQFKQVFRKERNVDYVLAGFDDIFYHVESHEDRKSVV